MRKTHFEQAVEWFKETYGEKNYYFRVKQRYIPEHDYGRKANPRVDVYYHPVDYRYTGSSYMPYWLIVFKK